MIYLSHYTSPLGAMTMASDGDHLIGLWFDGQKYDRANLKDEQLQEIADGEHVESIDQAKHWLDIYFSGAIPTFTPPIKLTGSPFRQRVLQQLMKIPYAHTTTYGEIANHIAQLRNIESMSAQAIGGAVGHNPISIIIPCHRVIGSQGKLSALSSQLSAKALTGYAGGLEVKRWLLNHESHYSI